MIRVYGDIMLDRWILGDASRISPEAPVPVLLEQEQKYSIGGAGNLALNIQSINGDVYLYGNVGQDKEGFKLLELLGATKLNTNIASDHDITTTKSRLVGQQGQHIVRWDKEKKYTGQDAFERLVSSIEALDIICISDYNKGTVTEATIERVLNKTNRILVDPKQNYKIYRGALLVKPNMKEYNEWNGPYNPETALDFMKKNNWRWLVVTDGANGMHVLNDSGEYKRFIEPVAEVADVTGAGDTVLAIIAHGIEKGMGIFDACKIACYGAARIVEKRGVAIVNHLDLNQGIVWTNGVFDILHTGHLELLRYASTLGKKLIVGINSDESTKKLKGNDRPINNQSVRKQNLQTLPWVDEVVIFNQETPKEIISKTKPNIIVKGGDYTVETVVGNEIANVVIFPTVKGHSTTEIIEKMKK